MSELDKLLESVEVEWKAMWEVTTWDKKFNAVDNFKQPKTIKYQHLLAKEIKELVSEKGNIKILTTNETNLWSTKKLVGSLISEGEVVAIPWGGNAIVQYYKGKFITGDNRIAISNDIEYLNTKYLYYFMLNNIQLLSSFYRGSGIKHPSMSKVLEIKIPIPPLKIQKEIVRILDTFTELTTELTTRKKQYEYYREQLLTFDENQVEWKALNKVAEYSKNRISYEELNENNYVGVDNLLQNKLGKTLSTRVPQKGNSIKYLKFDILIGNIRPYLKKIWYSDRTGGTNGDVMVIRTISKNIKTRFLYHVLADDKFFGYNMQHAKGAKMPRGNKDRIMEYKIPIPFPNDLEKSLKEQERIVSILDKFDVLTTSISEGLPKEIELRKKQYEYYREKLLSFPSLRATGEAI